jgi:hypothetical protein
MKRKAERPLIKVSLRVFAEDWEKLADLHPRLGPHRAVRELLHAHVRRVEEATAQQSPTLPEINIEA